MFVKVSANIYEKVYIQLLWENLWQLLEHGYLELYWRKIEKPNFALCGVKIGVYS